MRDRNNRSGQWLISWEPNTLRVHGDVANKVRSISKLTIANCCYLNKRILRKSEINLRTETLIQPNDTKAVLSVARCGRTWTLKQNQETTLTATDLKYFRKTAAIIKWDHDKNEDTFNGESTICRQLVWCGKSNTGNGKAKKTKR